jgi:hypothetical protein
MAKRRSARERDEATAHEQAEARREALLAMLREREAATSPDEPAPEASAATPEPVDETPVEDDSAPE